VSGLIDTLWDLNIDCIRAFIRSRTGLLYLQKGLFEVNAMRTHTRIAHQIGNFLPQYGRDREVRLFQLLSLSVAKFTRFISSITVVTIFIPVVLSVASKAHLNA